MKVSGFTICLSHQAKSDTSKHTKPTQAHTIGVLRARPPLGSEAGGWSTTQPKGGEHMDRSESGPAVSSSSPRSTQVTSRQDSQAKQHSHDQEWLTKKQPPLYNLKIGQLQNYRTLCMTQGKIQYVFPEECGGNFFLRITEKKTVISQHLE